MAQKSFQQSLDNIVRADPRYAAGAYVFVRMALDYTVKKLCSENKQRAGKHVSASELLDGIREFALESFGPMAYVVLEEWGVKNTADFGEIVFNLIECGELRRTEDDRREDFKGGYNFKAAFIDPFVPAAK